MWVGALTVVDTRSQATQVNLGVYTAIARNGKHIVTSCIELQALKPVTEFVECVA